MLLKDSPIYFLDFEDLDEAEAVLGFLPFTILDLFFITPALLPP